MDIGSLLMKIGIKVDGKELEGLQATVKKTASSFEALGSINNKLNFLVGAEAIRAMSGFVSRLGEESLQLQNIAAATNVSSDAFQRLRYAVGQSGSSVADLAPALTHLNRLIQDARLGGDDAIQTFYRLGISQAQISSFHNAEDALYAVMDAVNKIQDPIKRQVMLEKGLGGLGLARFALQGTRAAKASELLAKRMGAVVSPAATAEYAKARIALNQFGTTVSGVAANLFSGLAPAVSGVVNGLTEFYVANKNVIDTSITTWVNTVIDAMAILYFSFYVAARALVHFAAAHPQLVEFFEKFGLAIAGAAASFWSLKGVFSVISPLFKPIILLVSSLTLSGLAMAAQFALAAAAITGAFIALYSGYQMLHGKSFSETALAKSFEAIKGAAAAAKDAVADFSSQNFPGLTGLFSQRGYAPGEQQEGPLAPGQTLASMMTPAATPSYAPPIAAMLSQASPGSAGVSVQSNSTNNVTVNVNNGMSSDDAAKAVETGIHNAQTRHMQATLDRIRSPVHG